jgi:hypothetical protein
MQALPSGPWQYALYLFSFQSPFSPWLVVCVATAKPSLQRGRGTTGNSPCTRPPIPAPVFSCLASQVVVFKLPPLGHKAC